MELPTWDPSCMTFLLNLNVVIEQKLTLLKVQFPLDSAQSPVFPWSSLPTSLQRSLALWGGLGIWMPRASRLSQFQGHHLQMGNGLDHRDSFHSWLPEWRFLPPRTYEVKCHPLHMCCAMGHLARNTCPCWEDRQCTTAPGVLSGKQAASPLAFSNS